MCADDLFMWERVMYKSLLIYLNFLFEVWNSRLHWVNSKLQKNEFIRKEIVHQWFNQMPNKQKNSTFQIVFHNDF